MVGSLLFSEIWYCCCLLNVEGQQYTSHGCWQVPYQSLNKRWSAKSLCNPVPRLMFQKTLHKRQSFQEYLCSQQALAAHALAGNQRQREVQKITMPRLEIDHTVCITINAPGI